MSSGCGDVLSLEDLKTAKKHQTFEAEVITGHAGGVASGANIDYATNPVTGQVQKTMPAILRDLGYEPASFDFTSGGTLGVNDRNKAVLWPSSSGGDGDYYYWGGALPKVIPASSTPASTGGVADGAWRPVGDLTLRSELASAVGGDMVGMPQGGTLAQNLVTVSVDAFGADPTGATDSSPAVIAALQSVYGTTLDSKYYASRTKYVQILFGNGTYMLGDIPLIGGTDYVGQGRWATRIIPKAGATYCFKTVGSLPAGDAGGGGRYFNGCIRDMLIGDRYLSTGLAADVGGIYIANGSYFRLYNVDICRMTGPGLKLEALWDSQFFGLRIMYCGKDLGSGSAVPALYIGYTTTTGLIKEGSNGLQFYGLHVELSPQLIQMDYVAHVLINGCKLEGGPDVTTSSRFDNVQEVCVADAQLTWQKIAYPMFNFVPSGGMDQPTGIHFSSPRIVGNAANQNWIFNYSSTTSPLLISDITARNVTKLFTGANVVIDGGVTYNSGPTIVSGGNGTRVLDLICRQIPAVTTSADNTFILTGTESEVRGCYAQCAGTNSDGAAVVQVASGATDAKVHQNVFAGAKQYGILQNGVVTSRYIRDNVLAPTANYAALMTGSAPLNSAVLAPSSLTIATSAAGSAAVIGRASRITIRAVLGSTTATCELHTDSNGTKIVILGETSSGGTVMFQLGTGTAGDGTLRLTKSGATLTITNNTGSSGVFTINVQNIM